MGERQMVITHRAVVGLDAASSPPPLKVFTQFQLLQLLLPRKFIEDVVHFIQTWVTVKFKELSPLCLQLHTCNFSFYIYFEAMSLSKSFFVVSLDFLFDQLNP